MIQDIRSGDIPVISEVDILIVGGTGAGVALALAAARAGARVFLTGSRPYLGEDICGDLLLWPEAGEVPASELSRAIYTADAGPTTPMRAKLALEQALVAVDIPFLLNTFPADVLRDSVGRVCGVELATRTGHLRIHARLVIDATSEAVLGGLAGAPAREALQGLQTVLHTTLCQGDGADARGVDIVDRPVGFSGRAGEAEYRLSARTYSFEVDFGDGTLRDLARAEAEIVERCYVPGEFAHQERVRILTTKIAGEEGTTEYTEHTQGIPFHDGMCVLSPTGPGEESLRSVLERPVRAMDFATGLGEWAAGIAKKREVDFSGLRPGHAEPVILGSCDVLVLGGGTAGAPAAIAASRKGADTIVVESTDQLGGVGTAGQIARYWFGNKVGFTEEIDTGVRALETDPAIKAKAGQWSVAAKSHWYHHQCMDKGVTLLFRSLCSGAVVEDGRVVGLRVSTPTGHGIIRAKCVVDATGCADVAAAAGAPTRRIGADHVAVQGTGLAGIVPGKDYHNTDHNFCDDADVFDTTAFLVSSKLKYRDHFDAGQLVDSRERRQIIGDLELGPADFLSDRRYPDTICVASSNFDTHGFTIHPLFMCKTPHKKRLWADVPFRALLARGLERVLTTGLGLSAHRDALPVIRMQADVQNQGYAAGHAAARSAMENRDLRELPMREIQAHLVEAGILPQRTLTETDNFPVPEDRLQAAVSDGWDSHEGLALIFSEPDRAIPLLKAAYARPEEDGQRLRYALTLAFMGDPTGCPVLLDAALRRNWDEGWNYTGMGQFGMSLSEVDALLIALGRVGDAPAWPVLLEKMKSLPDNPDFSHCRAVAEACEALHPRCPSPTAAPALAGLLGLPGISGHAQTSLKSVQAALSDDPEDNALRNAALRELHLARALYRCGDHNALGQSILQDYSRDLRAHFARHARAVLD